MSSCPAQRSKAIHFLFLLLFWSN